MSFPVLHHDDACVAIAKPPGILVHRTPLARDRKFVLQQLRDQIGQRIYPVHRLDRATSGVLIFALSPDAARSMKQAFDEQQVRKEYLAIVRGWPNPPEGCIDRPIREPDGDQYRDAITHYRRLKTSLLPIPNRRYPATRFSLVSLAPETGRRHQLRIHMERIAYPIVGDTTHGDRDPNRIFRDRLGLRRLMLHAYRLQLPHPLEPEHALQLEATPDGDFARAMNLLGWRQSPCSEEHTEIEETSGIQTP